MNFLTLRKRERTADYDKDSMQRIRRNRWIGAVVLAVVALVAGAAWLLTREPCSHPSCAIQRFSVALEIDALGRVTPIDFDLSAHDEPHSLQSILRQGGVDVAIHQDQLALPYDPSSGALDRADLYQLVTAWRSRPVTPNVDATLYALFTSALVSDNGEELFGIMFDTAGREGFAVAPRTTERFFSAREPEAVATLQLRTFIHELLHALNRHHADAVSMEDGRLTLEAPTRCISDTKQREWGLRERPLMALSPYTIRFFQTASEQDVLPGPGNSPFKNLRTSPTECDDARMRMASLDDSSFWSTLGSRLRGVLAMKTAAAAQVGEPSEDPFVGIRLQAQPAAYPLGYPIAIRVQVTNESDEAVALVGRLNPAYGILTVEARRDDQSDWRVLQPLTWFEPSSDEEAMLEPDAEIEETIPVYFGEDGWMFPEPGEYSVRVRIRIGNDRPEVISAPLGLRVEAPRTPDDQAALQPLLNDAGELNEAVGRLLSFGGRIGKSEDLEQLEQVTEEFGHTAIGGALRLTLLSQRLRRPIDPVTGLRPPPDLSDARELLEDTCTDSGVAALTTDLLEQRPEGLQNAMHRRIESEASAWDGRSGSIAGSVIPTYSDPTLRLFGPSIHFCFNDAEIRRQVRGDLTTVARRLRREQPSRIVIVGHGDQSGSCRYNDALALRRARAVQRVLSAAGIRRDSIIAVSMGERRPLDFAASETAHSANRRVEILIEDPEELIEHAGAERLMPACSPR